MHRIDFEQTTISLSGARAAGAILRFDGPNRFLALDAPGRVTMYGVSFPTLAHAAAGAKIDPNDPMRRSREAIAELWDIAQAPSPQTAYAMGRKTLLREDWREVRFNLILELHRRKFANKLLMRKLLATGKVPIIAMAPQHLGRWGMASNGSQLTGNNWIGEILMHLRDDKE